MAEEKDALVYTGSALRKRHARWELNYLKACLLFDVFPLQREDVERRVEMLKHELKGETKHG